MKSITAKLSLSFVVLMSVLAHPQDARANSYKAFDTSPVRTVAVTGWQKSLTHTEGNLNQFYWTPIVKRYRDPNAVKLEEGHHYAKYGKAAAPINPHVLTERSLPAMKAKAMPFIADGRHSDSSLNGCLLKKPRATTNTSAKMLSYSAYGTNSGASYGGMGSGAQSSLSGKLLSMNH
jgi:hypothetical protein